MTSSPAGSSPQAHAIQADDTRLPKGHCRYILITPGLKGHRCACVSFMHNKTLPGATCDCGHLSCFHLNASEQPSPTTNPQELELLRQRVQLLEEHTDWGQHGGLGGVLNRVSQAEETVEKNREELLSEIKASYSSISGAWELVEQLQKRMTSFEDLFRIHSEQLSRAGKELGDLRNRHLELLDSDESLEERIEKLEGAGPLPAPSETLEGNAPSATHDDPTPSPVQEQHHTRELRRVSAPSLANSSSLDSWTIHISLLPSVKQSTPFEKDTIAYKRCLSRGLHRMVAVEGSDDRSFKLAVSRTFRDLLRGRSWVPLHAKARDASNLRGLPMLHSVEVTLSQRVYDRQFLRENCAVCDSRGRMESLYIAMEEHELSWEFLRQAPVYVEGLESSWTYDKQLDGLNSVGQEVPEINMSSPPTRSHVISPMSTGAKRSSSEISCLSEFASAATAMHDGEGPRKAPRTRMPGMMDFRRGMGTAL